MSITIYYSRHSGRDMIKKEYRDWMGNNRIRYKYKYTYECKGTPRTYRLQIVGYKYPLLYADKREMKIIKNIYKDRRLSLLYLKDSNNIISIISTMMLKENVTLKRKKGYMQGLDF